jgi:hypothetical protein
MNVTQEKKTTKKKFIRRKSKLSIYICEKVQIHQPHAQEKKYTLIKEIAPFFSEIRKSMQEYWPINVSGK